MTWGKFDKLPFILSKEFETTSETMMAINAVLVFYYFLFNHPKNDHVKYVNMI
jgi:hypothetical protein